MAIPFKCDEKVTIQRMKVDRDPDYGTPIPGAENWEIVLDRYWANVQDELPSRAESTQNGLRVGTQVTRLRMQGAGAVTGEMRAILHNRGDRVMQIIAGPALMNDRTHYEFKLEAYSNG